MGAIHANATIFVLGPGCAKEAAVRFPELLQDSAIDAYSAES